MAKVKFVRWVSIMALIALLVTAIPTQALASETEDHLDMPTYNQFDYPDVPYGIKGKSVADCGCGITSLAMVAAYLYQDESITPEYLATVYGNPEKKVEDVDYSSLVTMMVSIGTKHLGLDMELTYSFYDAVEALEEGKVVISLQNPGLFTSVYNGHFIVFRGVTEDGKILVRDPNGYTYNKYPTYFAEGFPKSKLWDTGSGYWVVTVAEMTTPNS